MPKPPDLGVLDWSAIFESGKDYNAWLEACEQGPNVEAMKELYEAQLIEPQVAAAVANLPKPIHVMVIGEEWCPDVVRHVPVLQKMADLSNNIQVRYFFRADCPEVFVRFLTNGGEAIPKFIFLSDAFVECGNWGPMPGRLVDIIARGKACNNIAKAREQVYALYQADDKRREVVEELLHRIDIASTQEP